PVTWTVADAALMLSALAGNHDRDMWSLEAPVADYNDRLDAGIAGLRVAFSPDLGYLRVDREIADAVRPAVSAFTDLGCTIEEVNPGWGDPIEMEHCLFASAYAGMLGPWLESRGDEMDAGLVALARHGQRYSAADYCRAQGERMAYYDKVHTFFERYDLLLTPALSVAAFPAE